MDLHAITQLLNWTYDAALNGIPGAPTVTELADDYLRKNASRDEAIDSLVRWQVSKSATAGFMTGLGGALTLPISVPASVASTLYIQLRMAAAIAHVRGFDVRSDHVRSFAFTCLCGDAAKDVLKRAGVEVGMKLGTAAIRRISGDVLVRINKAVGFRLLTKFGTKGTINLVKVVPVAGGIVGAAFDGGCTYVVGRTAKLIFPSC